MPLVRILAVLVLADCSPVSLEAAPRAINAQAGQVAVAEVAGGLDHPWSLAFLPDGRMLVTERSGNLRLVSKEGQLSRPLGGMPKVAASGQGGLLDVALAPDFASSRMLYLSYSEPGDDGSTTAVARGRLGDAGIENVQVIFRELPRVDGTKHYGSRLVFANDGKLFITLGERFQFDPAQDLSSHLGKVIRINPDGSVPGDNPFVNRQGAKPEIWSFGHRNVQGAALHPQTGKLWISEHGPRGGDEINIAEAGKNYGWPLVSWGRHYSGEPIASPSTRPDLAPSIYQWTPVIAASGMTFYTGALFPAWRGNLLVSGLVSRGIVRLTLDGDRVTGEERLPMGERIRDVRQGPDGAIYALTDDSDGQILRLTPAAREEGSSERQG
jgi:glucose/arabinose dehydrogenase